MVNVSAFDQSAFLSMTSLMRSRKGFDAEAGEGRRLSSAPFHQEQCCRVGWNLYVSLAPSPINPECCRAWPQPARHGPRGCRRSAEPCRGWRAVKMLAPSDNHR